jgi:hypothetical protein
LGLAIASTMYKQRTELIYTLGKFRVMVSMIT